MPITLLTFGKLDPCEDYDETLEILEKWLKKTTPEFLKSPEYKSLAKVNQKGRGEWFAFFMEITLGYDGCKLADIEAVSVQETLEDLFPRKLICSDTQAKTIVPELIAFWQFLRRECGDKKLEHAAEIVSYLESIKKDYLRIYNQEDDGDEQPLIPLDMVDKERPNFIPWVDWLISEVAFEYKKSGVLRLSADWDSMFVNPMSAFQLVQHLCLNHLELDDRVLESVRAILTTAFQHLFMQVRNKDAEALEVLAAMENNTVLADERELLNVQGARAVFHALVAHRAFLSPDFLHFIKQWRVESSEIEMASHGAAEMPSPDALRQIFLNMADEEPNEFLLFESLQELFGLFPVDGLDKIFPVLAESNDIRIGNVLALYVLDVEQDVALAALAALIKHPSSVGAVALNRLIRVRNWGSGLRQKQLDKLIQTVRKRGVMPAAPEQRFDIQEVWMPPVDGVGSQGVMLMLRSGSDYHLAGWVLKENAGVVDAFVSPPASKKELQAALKEAKSQVKMEKVSAELVRLLLPTSLAKHQHSHLPVDVELVQILEILALNEWHPQDCQLETLLPAELLVEPDTTEIDRVQTASKRWPSSAMGVSWFEDSEELAELCSQYDRKNVVVAICDQILEPQRQNWQERMLRMALWASYSHNKRIQSKAREFVVVWHLLGSERPMRDIALMERIATGSAERQISLQAFNEFA